MSHALATVLRDSRRPSARAPTASRNTLQLTVSAAMARHSPGTRDPAILATRRSSSTVDALQSASKAIYHSYLSESLAGRSPSWLSEGGWAGGGGGENGGRRPPARSNAARRRAKGAQRWRMAGPTSARARRARHPPTRGRGRRPRTAGGHGDGHGHGSGPKKNARARGPGVVDR